MGNMSNKLTPDKMKNNLVNSQLFAAVVGATVLINGVMGIIMYNNIGELKDEAKDRASVDKADNVFIMSTVFGAVAVAANVGYAVHLYTKSKLSQAWLPTPETMGFFVTVTIQLINLMVQTSWIIHVHRKVKSWVKSSRKCDAEGTAEENARAKKNADAAEGVAIATMVLVLGVFVYYMVALGIVASAAAHARKMYNKVFPQTTSETSQFAGGGGSHLSNVGFSTLVGGCGGGGDGGGTESLLS